MLIQSNNGWSRNFLSVFSGQVVVDLLSGIKVHLDLYI